MSRWRLVFTKRAQKDAKKVAATGLRKKAQTLLDILAEDPFQSPPPFEKLVGDLTGAFSRRINIGLSGAEGRPYGEGPQHVDTLRVRMVATDHNLTILSSAVWKLSPL